MKQSFFVQSIVNVDDNGLFVNVDLEKTNEAINQLLTHLQGEGFIVETIIPTTSGVGQFQRGPIDPSKSRMMRWLKPMAGGYGYGFGYSYTNGFMILASQP